MVKVLSLNLRHGGGKRVPMILDYLQLQAPDVFIAPEYRHGKTGAELCEGLRALGFRSFSSGIAESPRMNSVLVAATADARVLRFQPESQDSQRIAGVRVDGVDVIGVYFANMQAKHSLFDYLHTLPHPRARSPCLLLGDFNTGSHHIDEPGTVFHCADKFERLAEIGWVDLWRTEHGQDAREFTWYSHTGNGFRLDHAFANRSASSKVTRCGYDHSTRAQLTDHSAIIVETEL